VPLKVPRGPPTFNRKLFLTISSPISAARLFPSFRRPKPRRQSFRSGARRTIFFFPFDPRPFSCLLRAAGSFFPLLCAFSTSPVSLFTFLRCFAIIRLAGWSARHLSPCFGQNPKYYRIVSFVRFELFPPRYHFSFSFSPDSFFSAPLYGVRG